MISSNLLIPVPSVYRFYIGCEQKDLASPAVAVDQIRKRDRNRMLPTTAIHVIIDSSEISSYGGLHCDAWIDWPMILYKSICITSRVSQILQVRRI